MRARPILAGRRADALAILGLLGLVLIFNPGLAFEGKVLGGYDAFVYFYPLRAYFAASVAEGRLPLWNPHLFLGVPFLANPQTAVFYPGTWLFALTDVPRAYALNYLGHLVVAAVGMYGLARCSLGVGPLAGVLGGAAFAFSGFMGGQAGHINQVSVAAWLPAVALALDLALRRGSVVAVALLVIGLVLQILAGHPQEVYMTLVALGLLVLWQRAASGPLAVARGLAVLGVATGLALGISAAQLLPTAELSDLSIRGGGLSYQIAAFDALPWPLLLPALFPGYWSHLPTTEFFGHTAAVFVAVAWLGLTFGRARPAMLGALYVVLGLVLAVGDATPLYRLLFDWAPGFSSFRVPARWLLVSTFGLSLLVAVGVDWLAVWRGAGLDREHVAGRPSNGSGVVILSAAKDLPSRPVWFGRSFAALRMTAWMGGLGHALRQRRMPGAGRARLLLFGLGVPLGLFWLVAYGQRQSRWLLLVWGALVLAGVLLALVSLMLPRLRVPALAALLLGGLGEAWLAGAGLEHRNPIPNVVYGRPGEAAAELLARDGMDSRYRMLSIATPEYVHRESPALEGRYGGLPKLALDNLLVALKWNDTLWPNVPLVYGLDSADGYDGGVLPLRAYVDLTGAMLGSDRVRPDGVLASRLDSLPDARWLDLLGVRYVLTSKAKDAGREVVELDRAVSVALRPGGRLELGQLPLGEFTRLMLLSSYAGAAPPGGEVGRLELDAGDGRLTAISLREGQETAPATAADRADDSLERVEPWSRGGADPAADWLAEIPFARQPVARLAIVNTSNDATLSVRSLNLIDDVRQAAFPVTPDQRIDRTEFFDLKLYERQDALPRVYFVANSRFDDAPQALDILADPAFDPRQYVVLQPLGVIGPGFPEGPTGVSDRTGTGTVAVEENRPESLRVRVSSDSSGYVVVSDSWFPGWQATVDGQPRFIRRANVLFRAVFIEAGEHLIELRYAPSSVRIGLLVSATTSLAALALLGGAFWWRARRLAAGPPDAVR